MSLSGVELSGTSFFFFFFFARSALLDWRETLKKKVSIVN